jgi:hypothetical protein
VGAKTTLSHNNITAVNSYTTYETTSNNNEIFICLIKKKILSVWNLSCTCYHHRHYTMVRHNTTEHDQHFIPEILVISAAFSITVILTDCRNRDIAAGIVTGYGLDDRGVGVRVPVRLRIFSSPRRPDRLWGPPNLPNEYRRLLPRG